MAMRLKSVAWRRVVGLMAVIAGRSDGLGASRRGTTGERWLAETVEERRERSMVGTRRPVRSFASPREEVGFGGMTSSRQVKPR
jgi:hypothetical protein